MTKIIQRFQLLPLLILALPVIAQSDNLAPYNTNSFFGDLGFIPSRTEVEPKIGREDYDILEQARVLSKSEPSAAIELLSNKISGDPRCSSVYDFALATLLYQQNRSEDAIVSYHNTLKKDPNFLRAVRNLAYVLIQQQSYAHAIVQLSKALSLGDASSDAYGMLGYCHLMLGNHSSAENAYRFAMVRDPENLAIQNGLIRCLEAMGRYEETVGLLDELIRKNPTDPAYWLTQVNSLNQLGQHRRAIANIEILRRMNKASEPALLLLGDLYLNMELPKLAEDAYSAALQLKGNLSPRHFIRAASQLANQNAYDLAIAYANQIQARYGDIMEKEDELRFLNLRARLFLYVKQYAQSAQILEKLIQQDPLNGEALILLGRSYTELQNFPRASIAFERAARTPSSSPGNAASQPCGDLSPGC
jgi:tetratricopeptide (TPR) repeat protein